MYLEYFKYALFLSNYIFKEDFPVWNLIFDLMFFKHLFMLFHLIKYFSFYFSYIILVKNVMKKKFFHILVEYFQITYFVFLYTWITLRWCILPFPAGLSLSQNINSYFIPIKLWHSWSWNRRKSIIFFVVW